MPIYRSKLINITCFIYDIYIQVIGFGGLPLPGSSVVLSPIGNFSKTLSFKNITDSQGLASFINIPKGVYSLKVYSNSGTLLASSHLNITKHKERFQIAVETIIEEEKYLKIHVNNSLPVAFQGDYFELNALFSYGVAINGSLRLLDEDMNKIPFQIINAEYYPQTEYYKKVDIIFPINVPELTNKTLRLYYSLSRKYFEQFPNTDLKVDKSENGSYFKIENEYYNAYVSTSSTRGIYMFIPKDIGENIINPSWGFPNIRLILENGSAIDLINIKETSDWKIYEGPLMVEICYNTIYGDLRFQTSLRFYSSSPFIDVLVNMKGKNIPSSILPIHLMFPKGLFYGCYLYNSTENFLMAETGSGMSTPPSDLVYLSFLKAGGGIIVSLKPSTSISRIMLRSDMPDYDLIAFQYIPVTPLTNASFNYRLSVYREPFKKKDLDSFLLRWKYKPPLKVENPPAIISIKAPNSIEVDKEFKFIANITPLAELYNVSVSIESPTIYMETRNSTVKIFDELPSNSSTSLTYLLKFIKEGHYLLIVSFKSSMGEGYAYFPIRVRLPYLLPFINVTFKIVDYDGNSTIANQYPVSVLLESLENEEAMLLLSNKTGFVSAKVCPGLYRLKVLAQSRLIDYKELSLFEEGSIKLIPTWTYDVNIELVDLTSRPLPNLLVVLTSTENHSIAYINTTGSDGFARFENVLNGTYKIYLADTLGRILSEQDLNVLCDDENIRICLPISNVFFKLLDLEGDPISNATVYILDNKGLSLMGRTDSDGLLKFYCLPIGNYSIRVEYLGLPIYSQDALEIKNNTSEVELRANVASLVVVPLDEWLNPLRNSQVEVSCLEIVTTQTYRLEKKAFTLSFKQHDNKSIRVKLPLNYAYEVKISSGFYSYRDTIDLKGSTTLTARSRIISNLWFYIGAFASLWLALGLVWRHRYRRISLEDYKLRSMLDRLEKLYSSGEIEEKIYRKLKEEYTDRLKKLSKKG